MRRSGFKNLPTLLVNKGIKYMLTIYIQFACIYFIYHKKHFLLYALHIFAVWANVDVYDCIIQVHTFNEYSFLHNLIDYM